MSDNIISLKAKKRQYFVEGCSHDKVLVDEELWNVTCRDCGKELDPVKFLIRLADAEQSKRLSVDSLADVEKATIKRIEERKQFKCDHCGKITKINV